MTYRGRVQNGAVVFDDEVALPERVIVRVEQLEPPKTDGNASSWAGEMLKLAGTAKGLPSDLARNHDHYLYGHPKR